MYEICKDFCDEIESIYGHKVSPVALYDLIYGSPRSGEQFMVSDMTKGINEKLDDLMKNTIVIAKEKVMSAFDGDKTRQWIGAQADSYKNPKYRIELLVLEGSPAKGYILIDYRNRKIIGFDCSGKKIFDKCILKEIEKNKGE